jgi:adenylate cyclase
MLGELVPVGGGDPVPLLKETLLVGRRESCDIVLRFPNVSSHHCQLECHGGYWYVRDLNSKNGTRVNGARISEKRIDPGDELRVAKHRYKIEYSPIDLGAVGPPPSEFIPGDVMQKSLLERAGLERLDKPGSRGRGRMDLLDDEPRRLFEDRNKPV